MQHTEDITDDLRKALCNISAVKIGELFFFFFLRSFVHSESFISLYSSTEFLFVCSVYRQSLTGTFGSPALGKASRDRFELPSPNNGLMCTRQYYAALQPVCNADCNGEHVQIVEPSVSSPSLYPSPRVVPTPRTCWVGTVQAQDRLKTKWPVG